MDVEALKDRGYDKYGLRPGRTSVTLSAGSVKKAWGVTRRGSLKPGDTVGNEGRVHQVKDGNYTHEVKLLIGEEPWTSYARPETVFAFSESNVGKE